MRKQDDQSFPEPVTEMKVSDMLVGPTLTLEVNTPAVDGNSKANLSAVNLPRRLPVVPPSVNQPNPTSPFDSKQATPIT